MQFLQINSQTEADYIQPHQDAHVHLRGNTISSSKTENVRTKRGTREILFSPSLIPSIDWNGNCTHLQSTPYRGPVPQPRKAYNSSMCAHLRNPTKHQLNLWGTRRQLVLPPVLGCAYATTFDRDNFQPWFDEKKKKEWNSRGAYWIGVRARVSRKD